MRLPMDPISRLIAGASLGGVAGYFVVGGPIGVVGGIILGGIAEQVLEYVTVSNKSMPRANIPTHGDYFAVPPRQGPYENFMNWMRSTPGFIPWVQQTDATLPGLTDWLEFMTVRNDVWNNSKAYAAHIVQRWPTARPYINAILAGYAQDIQTKP